MSDDSITGFLQPHSATERTASLDNPSENDTQDTDFKEVIYREEKKLSGAQLESKPDKQAVVENPQMRIAPTENSGEATQGQIVNISGNSFPNLSLHNGALAVGRVIYTSAEVSVTSESLSKFMVRQGLVNQSLFGAGDSSDLDAPGNENTEEALVSHPQISSHQAFLEGEAEVKPGSSEQNPERSFKDNAVTQLSVKQVINTRGVVGVSKLESPLGQNLSANTIARAESNKIDQDQAARVEGGLWTANLVSGGETSSTGKQSREVSSPPSALVGRGDPLSIDQQPGPAPKPGLEGNQGREAANPLNTLVGRGDQPSINQQFQDEAKPAVTDSKNFSEQSVLKNKDNQDDASTKNQPLLTKDESEPKKLQSSGQLELQRFLATAQKVLESGSERPNSTLLNQPDINDASVKGHRDLNHYTTQESAHADPGQGRVEFKGALRDAQRLVASGTYNNLTDSYESWSSRFGEVLAHRIAGYINKENWSVQLRMNPASLGEISLEIDFSDKGLEGRFGSNEESTRQLLHDTLPKLRLALREILEENQHLNFDVSDFGNSNQDEEPEKNASPELVEEINFESEVLLGRTLDSELSSVVGLDILV